MITGGVGMSYKIQYSPETSSLYPQTAARKQLLIKRWIPAAIAIVAAVWIHFYGVPDFLIPGDPVITKAAASAMVGEIKNGTALGDAITTFCKMILDGAEVLY